MRKGRGLKIFRLGNIPSKIGKWGTILKIVCDEKTPTESLVVGVVTINSNMKIAAHYHNIEELQYILSGKGIVYDRKGKGHSINQGDFVYCPSKEIGTHSFENTGNEPLFILYVYPSHSGKSLEVITYEKKERI
jgi:quercetin dioxygenase-like cupin family protein